VIAVGVLDMGATAAYLAATQAGPLAIAGVLSALYPVMTVLLAATILRERITRVHALGIVAAAAAIALIARWLCRLTTTSGVSATASRA